MPDNVITPGECEGRMALLQKATENMAKEWQRDRRELYKTMDERDQRMHERDRERDTRQTQVEVAMAKTAPQADVESLKLSVQKAQTCADVAKKSIGKWWYYVGAIILIILTALVTAYLRERSNGPVVVKISKEELKKIVETP